MKFIETSKLKGEGIHLIIGETELLVLLRKLLSDQGGPNVIVRTVRI